MKDAGQGKMKTADNSTRKDELIKAENAQDIPRPDAKGINILKTLDPKTGTIGGFCSVCGQRIRKKKYHEIYELLNEMLDEQQLAAKLYPDYNTEKLKKGARIRLILQALRKLERLGLVKNINRGSRWRKAFLSTPTEKES